MSKNQAIIAFWDRLEDISNAYKSVSTSPDGSQYGDRIHPIKHSSHFISEYLNVLADLPASESDRSIDKPMIAARIFLRLNDLIYNSTVDGEYKEEWVYNTRKMVRNNKETKSSEDAYNLQKRPEQLEMVKTIYQAAKEAINASQDDPALQVNLIGLGAEFLNQAFKKLGVETIQPFIHPAEVLSLQARAVGVVERHIDSDNRFDIATEVHSGRSFGPGMLSLAQHDRRTNIYADLQESFLQNEEKLNATVLAVAQTLSADESLELLKYVKPQGNILKKKIWRQKRRNYQDQGDARRVFQLSLENLSLDRESHDITTEAMRQIDVTEDPYNVLNDLCGHVIGPSPLFVLTKLNKPHERLSYTSLVGTVMAHNALLAAYDQRQEDSVRTYKERMLGDVNDSHRMDHRPLRLEQLDYYQSKQYAVKNLLEIQDSVLNSGEKLQVVSADDIPFDDFTAIAKTVPGQAWLQSVAGDVRDAVLAITDVTPPAEQKRLKALASAVSSVLPDEQKAEFVRVLASTNTADMTSVADVRRDQFSINNAMTPQHQPPVPPPNPGGSDPTARL